VGDVHPSLAGHRSPSSSASNSRPGGIFQQLRSSKVCMELFAAYRYPSMSLSVRTKFFEFWSHIRQQLPWGTQCLKNMCHKRSRYRGCSIFFGRGMESAHFEKCSSNVMMYWFERAECGCAPIKSMDTRSHASSTKGDHFTKL